MAGGLVLAKIAARGNRHMGILQNLLGPGKAVVGVRRDIGIHIKCALRLRRKLKAQWRKCC